MVRFCKMTGAWRWLALLLAVLSLAGVPAQAAIRALPGFSTGAVPRNDDGYTDDVDLGFDINFFEAQFSQVAVNNNGNVTFGSGLSTYTPFPLTSTYQPIIAPFFGDVDTRDEGSNLVTYGQDTVDGHRAFGVNWSNVGYYDEHSDKLNSFQMVLIDRSDTGPGNFDIEFNYDRLAWETGDASGGQDGFGGTPARAGWSNGSGAPNTFFELPGSGVNGGLLGSALTSRSIASAVPGRYVFPIRNGAGRLDVVDAASLNYLDVPPTAAQVSANLSQFTGGGDQVLGAAADGASRVLLRFVTDVEGNVTFSQVADGSGETLVPGGSLRVAGSTQTASSVVAQTVPWNDKYVAFAMYYAPRELSDASGATLARADFHFTARQERSDGEPREVSKDFHLERPPVVLAHGLWSDASTWGPEFGNLVGVFRALKSLDFTVSRLDYRNSNASSFYSNRLQILSGSGGITELQTQYKRNRIALTRVDVVGHSMGGILARELVNSENYRTRSNYGQGWIRRLVTIGTPHFGSPIATSLVALQLTPQGRTAGLIAAALDHSIYDGAIDDLAALDVGRRLGPARVPSYAVTSAVTANVNEENHSIIAMLHFLGIGTSGFSGSHDLIVGVESQRGDIGQFSAPFTSWHIKETSDDAIGDLVAAKLVGSEAGFDTNGFPTQVANLRQQQQRAQNAQVLAAQVKKGIAALDVTDTPLVDVTPADGAAFDSSATGTPLQITATPLPGVDVRSVLISVGDTSAVLNAAPFSTSLNLPPSVAGDVPLVVIARDASNRVQILRRTIFVRPGSSLQSLRVTPAPVTLTSLGSARQLHVFGLYSDGIEREISSARAGTTYASDNSSVATVDANGLVTAVGSGNVIISISNGDVSATSVRAAYTNITKLSKSQIKSQFARNLTRFSAASTRVVVTVAPQAPRVLGLTPPQAATINGAPTTVSLAIEGENLGGTNKISFLRAGVPDTAITVDDFQVDSGGRRITARLTLAAGIAAGPRTVTVSNVAGTSSLADEGNNRFEIVPSALTLTLAAAQISERGATTNLTIARNTATDSALRVSLLANFSGVLQLPTTVEIPRGEVSVTIPVSAINNNLAGDDRSVLLTASAAGFQNGQATLSVLNDDRAALSLVLAASRVSESAAATPIVATVTRNTPVAAALTVALRSTDSSEARVPRQVVIPAGRAAISFEVQPIDDLLFDGPHVATIVATATGHDAATATLAVLDNEARLLSVQLIPDRVRENSRSGILLEVKRNTEIDAQTPALVVGLSAFPLRQLNVPSRIVIPARTAFIRIPISLINDSVAQGPHQVQISARAAGYATASGALTILDDDLTTPQVIRGRVLLPSRFQVPNARAATPNLGVAGVTVTLRRGSLVLDSVLTNGAGQFVFDNLPVGNYTVTVAKTNLLITPPTRAVALTVAQPAAALEFGVTPDFAISGRVRGLNADGVNVPLRNVVVIARGRATSVQTRTAADGSYRFTRAHGLLLDTYFVAPLQVGQTFSPTLQRATLSLSQPQVESLDFLADAADRQAPGALIDTPSNGQRLTQTPALAGRAVDNGSGIALVTLTLVRLDSATARTPNAFWDWSSARFVVGENLSRTQRPIDVHLAPTPGQVRWSVAANALPDLLDGFYGVRVTAIDAAANSTTTNFQRFSIVVPTTPKAATLENAPAAPTSRVRLSSASADQSSGTVRLVFSGSLAAADVANLQIERAGENVEIMAVFTASNVLTLHCEEGILHSGDALTVRWHALQDAHNGTLPDGETVLTLP